MTGHVLVRVGPRDISSDTEWISSGVVSKVVSLHHAAKDGRRCGSRALGLGVDSLLVALKVMLTSPRTPYIAANPWIGVALRLFGRSVIVTGIYAEPGSRSWKLLRRALRSVLVLPMSVKESEAWNRDGGTSIPLRYGNTFPYPPRRIDDPSATRVFVGGSSDRDLDLLTELVTSCISSDLPLSFDLAMGAANAELLSAALAPDPRVRIHQNVSQDEFGRLLSMSDICLLPLLESRRAAGHMVAVGALQLGIPVLSSVVESMSEYVDGIGLFSITDQRDLPSQVLEVAARGRDTSQRIRDEWHAQFSRTSYVQRVGSAIHQAEGRTTT